VKWWALAGGASLAIFAATWIAWAVSGNMKPTPPGPTPVPGWMMAALRIHEFGAAAVLVFCVYWWVMRHVVRRKPLSLDGMLVIALLSGYWQDQLSNFLRFSFNWNAHFINWGSWSNFLPLWVVPKGNLFPEPVLFEWSLYVIAILPGMIFGNWLMRKASARYPHWGAVRLLTTVFVLFAAMDIAFEIGWLRLGLYTYPSAIRWLTLFHGHYYQFPLLEAVFYPFCWTLLTALRYYRNDKGETIVERGIEKVHATYRQKRVLRVLALCGAWNVILFFSYNMPMGLIHGLYGDTWPQDIVKRSYFTYGMCGPGTEYACPSQSVPIPHKGSAHVDTQGELVVPADNDSPPWTK
jgi:hypothetical protein